METGAFWKRMVGEGIGDATPIDEAKIPASLFRCVTMDRAIGVNGITIANARIYLRLLPGTTALTEFNDLVDSIANITNANSDVQRGRRQVVSETVSIGAELAERGTKIGGGVNPYETGEALRLRTKALIIALAPAGAGALVGSMAV